MTVTQGKRPPRPKRQKKSDRLLTPGAGKDEIACDYALAPMDRKAREMDLHWGIDRLPELVSPETAQRYGYAMADLNAAIEKNDPAAVLATANNCMKGLDVMHAEAIALGATPARGEFWEYKLEDGDPGSFHFAVMADAQEWMTAQDQRPDLTFYTLREVAIALRAYTANRVFAEVKKQFPKSEINKIKNKEPVDWKNGGDPLELYEGFI